MSSPSSTSVLIMGAAGKDFHVFNTCYRDRDNVRVVCFTATQIPGIDRRSYPSELAGDRYPEGIPIHPEEQLEELIQQHDVDDVIFAYSDVSEEYIQARREQVEEAGAAFHLAPVEDQYLTSRRSVVSVCAVRTGAGKSQTSRYLSSLLRGMGWNVGVVRHPMPYGDLLEQEVQRFETLSDMEDAFCTIEEMEEYEQHIQHGNVVYAGVDYEKVLREAEKESDVILWDGGNNDTPFFRPDLHIVVCDPLRAGQELTYYPGWINFERADVLLVNKIDSASAEQVDHVLENARRKNPDATVVRAESPVTVDDPEAVEGARVVCVEDGPSLTHGGMETGAAFVAAQRFGAGEVIDPRPHAVGSLKETYETYEHIGPILPAMGYSDRQLNDLRETLSSVDADLILMGTPVGLGRLIELETPAQRVTYELREIGSPTLLDVLCRTGDFMVSDSGDE